MVNFENEWDELLKDEFEKEYVSQGYDTDRPIEDRSLLTNTKHREFIRECMIFSTQ